MKPFALVATLKDARSTAAAAGDNAGNPGPSAKLPLAGPGAYLVTSTADVIIADGEKQQAKAGDDSFFLPAGTALPFVVQSKQLTVWALGTSPARVSASPMVPVGEA